MAERQGAHCASGGGPGERPLSSADRSGVGICGARRHHHVALVGRRRSASATPIATAAAAHGTIACSPTLTASRPIPSGFTACSAMPGSGPRIAGTRLYRHAPTDGSAWTEPDCRQSCHSRRLVAQSADLRPLRRAQRQRARRRRIRLFEPHRSSGCQRPALTAAPCARCGGDQRKVSLGFRSRTMSITPW